MLQTITNSYFKLFLFLIFSITLESIDSKNDSTTIDPFKFLHIIPNPDGTITRIKEYYPVVPPNPSFDLSYSKDTVLNPIKNTWVRTYLPSNLNFTQPVKLPVVVYAHGGGFILLSAATPNFDRFCALMANRLGVIVVSVDYRLAPENRLPAAYEDVLDALYWLKDGNDDWVKSYGDVSECVLMGESAGGNIAYMVGLKASTLGDVFNPLIIRGMVLMQPFFGGIDRSGSELRLDKTGALPLVVTDLMWDMSLPIGTNRNYWFCNPFSGDGLEPVKRIRELGWRVAVVGCDGDPLFDRQVELVKWLGKQGVYARGSFSKGHFHGVFVNDYGVAQQFFEFVRSVFSQT